eukprot:363427-Chlamydomonas_euryale.AAC.7
MVRGGTQSVAWGPGQQTLQTLQTPSCRIVKKRGVERGQLHAGMEATCRSHTPTPRSGDGAAARVGWPGQAAWACHEQPHSAFQGQLGHDMSNLLPPPKGG